MTVGEVWVHSPDLLPNSLWALPTLTEKTLKAHPILHSDLKDELPADLRLQTIQKEIGGKSVHESTLEDDFVRTSLFGFLVDGDTIPGLDKPRLFLCGIKRDRVIQKRLTVTPQGERIQCRDVFFSNHLMGAVHSHIHGISAWYAFIRTPLICQCTHQYYHK